MLELPCITATAHRQKSPRIIPETLHRFPGPQQEGGVWRGFNTPALAAGGGVESCVRAACERAGSVTRARSPERAWDAPQRV
jgi:hypothetical protein